MKIERTEDLETCRAIRRVVFVQEQNVPEDEEWDGLDGAAIHLLARDDQGAAVGTARILLADGTGKIGRVAVLKPVRGTGAGAALIRAAPAEFPALPGVLLLYTSAPADLLTRLQLGWSRVPNTTMTDDTT